MSTRKPKSAAVPGLDRILSIPDVASHLSISTKTVRRLVAKEKLRMIRITPGRVGIRQSEVARYIAEREKVA